MSFIENIKTRAKENLQTIVLPESMDIRVLKAGEKVLEEGIANIIFIGNEDEIKSTGEGLNLEKGLKAI